MDWTAEDYNASKIAHSNKAAAEIIAQATVRAAKINARDDYAKGYKDGFAAGLAFEGPVA